MNNIIDALKSSSERILNYYKEYSKKNNDEFDSGVKLGLRMALGVLQTDLDVFDVNGEDILKEIGLDIDLDKI